MWNCILSYRNQSINLQIKIINWFLYDRDRRHEKVNALLLVCIYRDIFLDLCIQISKEVTFN